MEKNANNTTAAAKNPSDFFAPVRSLVEKAIADQQVQSERWLAQVESQTQESFRLIRTWNENAASALRSSVEAMLQATSEAQNTAQGLWNKQSNRA